MPTTRSKLVAEDGPPTKPQVKKRTKKQAAAKSELKSEPEPVKQEDKPRLATPDLEFDWDRSQLRDPRPTPGRVKRPRWEDRDLTEDFKARFHIPKPPRPPGRLNWVIKDELLREECRLDPSQSFHSLYECHDKGPEGSPTYDRAGFQLDWHKVDNWMKPKPYNKKAMVRGMEKAVDKAQNDQRQMSEIFFKDGKGPTGLMDYQYEHYMKDQVSKDLGVPIHQIEPAHFREWEQKGLEKPVADEWWRVPTDEEKKRASKMLSGASLRKDL